MVDTDYFLSDGAFMTKLIHPLSLWLFLHDETAKEFAERSRVSRVSLSLLMNGHTQPTLQTIMRIRKATGGDVKAADFEAFELEATGELT